MKLKLTFRFCSGMTLAGKLTLYKRKHYVISIAVLLFLLFSLISSLLSINIYQNMGFLDFFGTTEVHPPKVRLFLKFCHLLA